MLQRNCSLQKSSIKNSEKFENSQIVQVVLGKISSSKNHISSKFVISNVKLHKSSSPESGPVVRNKPIHKLMGVHLKMKKCWRSEMDTIENNSAKPSRSWMLFYSDSARNFTREKVYKIEKSKR